MSESRLAQPHFIDSCFYRFSIVSDCPHFGSSFFFSLINFFEYASCHQPFWDIVNSMCLCSVLAPSQLQPTRSHLFNLSSTDSLHSFPLSFLGKFQLVRMYSCSSCLPCFFFYSIHRTLLRVPPTRRPRKVMWLNFHRSFSQDCV